MPARQNGPRNAVWLAGCFFSPVDMEREMSSGVPYYERDLLNLLCQGRSNPAVPLILIGVLP